MIRTNQHSTDHQTNISQSHVYRLSDYHALLLHRASVSVGSERSILLTQADKINNQIEHFYRYRDSTTNTSRNDNNRNH